MASRSCIGYLSHGTRFIIIRNLKQSNFQPRNLLQVNKIRYSSQLSKPLPKGTWDSHMHVVEPDRFPLSPTAKYTPHAHTISQARSFYSQLRIENMVFVQPSIYATDNSCMLEALREVTPQHGRAVVELDPDKIRPETLREWHEIGVRGVRVNLVSVGREVTESELRTELERYARVIRPVKTWVLQLYIPLKLAGSLEKIVPDLGVKVCIDHFGSPTLPSPFDPSKAVDPYDLEGFQALINLLKAGKTWVKLSAHYRITKDPGEMRDLQPIGRELIRQAPDRVVYSTDWPHTRYDNIDSVPFIEICYGWCGEGTGLVEKLFRTNAEELWDVSRS